MNLAPSELILNPYGSVYHLNLKPEDVALTIILVGDLGFNSSQNKAGQYTYD